MPAVVFVAVTDKGHRGSAWIQKGWLPNICRLRVLLYLIAVFRLSRVVIKIVSYGRAVLSLQKQRNSGLVLARGYHKYPAKTV